MKKIFEQQLALQKTSLQKIIEEERAAKKEAIESL